MPIYGKNSPFTISIKNNTNRVVSSSQDNFQGIRPGSFIRISSEEYLYQIGKTNKIFYVKDFKVLDNKTIEFPGDCDISLQEQDLVNISFKEYELDSIIDIPNKGSNYSKDDILTLSGGNLTIDIKNGMGSPTKLKVDLVGENGEILSLSLDSPGKYLSPPSGDINLLGGNGFGAKIGGRFSVISNRNVLERVIKKIDILENKTRIQLDYSLPESLKEGSLSCNKFEMFLSGNYLGESGRNLEYTVFKDRTPGIGLPLLVKNSQSLDLIVNRTFGMIDSEISKLKKEIEELKKNKI